MVASIIFILAIFSCNKKGIIKPDKIIEMNSEIIFGDYSKKPIKIGVQIESKKIPGMFGGKGSRKPVENVKIYYKSLSGKIKFNKKYTFTDKGGKTFNYFILNHRI